MKNQANLNEKSNNSYSSVIISRKTRNTDKAFIYLDIVEGEVFLTITSKFLNGTKYFPGPSQKVEETVPEPITKYLKQIFDKEEVEAPEEFPEFLENIWGTFEFGQQSWKGQ